MELQFLIPQYNEDENTIKTLLDSIKNQDNVDFKEIGAVIVNDGSPTLLSDGFLKQYPYNIKYIKNKHSGVSSTRNKALDEATADYVMFCDADDKFFSTIGVFSILQSIKTTPFDALICTFIEEIHGVNGEIIYNTKENDSIFVHGKVYNRKFLIDNNIRWKDGLNVHEDSYFNCLALAIAKNKRLLPNPNYMWCWNKDSVSRHDKYYIPHTYTNLLHSATYLSDELWKRGYKKDSISMFLVNLYQTFYVVTGTFSTMSEVKKDISNINKESKIFFDKFKDKINTIDLQSQMQIRQNCFNAALKQGWYSETITFPQWIKIIESIKN